MEKKEKSAKFLNQRKFFVVVPLVILPFLTLFFWSLGGGTSTDAQELPKEKNGLNTSIPDANINKNNNPNKMAFYDNARRDSNVLRSKIASDPYYRKSQSEHESTLNQAINSDGFRTSNLNSSLKGSSYRDPNEAKVYQKLDQLNSAINTQATIQPKTTESFRPASGTVNSADIDRLEKMMKTMGEKDGDDPEMQQINAMLEKILDIQHPDRVTEKLKTTSEMKRGQVFPVAAGIGVDAVNLFPGTSAGGLGSAFQNQVQTSGFFSLEEPFNGNTSANAITAVVHDSQILVNGSTVKLRLTTDIYINGVLIPKDNFLYGTASLSGDRLGIEVSSLQYENSIFPVALTTYDIDGLPGIYIPDAISRNVAKESADRAVQSMGITSFDPSLGAQAAGAGIEAVRNIISKKVRLIKVTVKAGYQVLLRDGKAQGSV